MIYSRVGFAAAFFLTFSAFIPASSARAERPSAARLLPASTVGYLRIANVPDLVEKFRETSMGRLARDEKIRPLISQLYGSATEAFAEAQEQLGLSLEELLKIPQGEVALALAAPGDDVAALVLLVDVGDQLDAANRLLEQAEAAAVMDGASVTTETIDGVELRIVARAGQRRPPVYFVREGTVVVSTSVPLARQLVAAWSGGEGERLLDAPQFTTIMRKCLASEEHPPQITWFVDPVELAVAVTRGNFSAQAFVALTPVLGLDGVKGVGGAFTLGAGDFDTVTHVHLLLEQPREGLVQMLALGSGETKPELWVPGDIASYTTLHWDVKKTYQAAAEVYDRFREEGALARQAQDRFARLWPDLNFETDILDALDGRFSLVGWMEPPARINSEVNLLGVKLKDPARFRNTLKALIEPFRDRVEEDSFGGVTYYRVRSDDAGNGQPDQELLRRPTPCFGVVGDYLLVTGSEKLLEHVVVTKSNTTQSLAKELDFKLIASKISRQPGGEKPGLISFNRPEEGMRVLYEVAASQQARDWLGQRSERNRAFGALRQALDDNPLPPFAVIQKYLAPGGAVLINDETGFHYTAFSLKRE